MRGRGVLVPAILAAVLLAASGLLARAARAARDPEARASGGAPPLGIVNVVAVDLLWIRADTLFAENRWAELLAAYEAVGALEPRLTASWEYRGFHLAYNLAGNAADPADRDRWVMEGIRVLEEGLRRNPGGHDLRSYLGHVLFERSERWPDLARRLRAARRRAPLDEAIELQDEALRAEPDHPLRLFRLLSALLVRGRRALDAAEPGTPAPAAAADFRSAVAALEAFTSLAPPGGNEMAVPLRRDFENLARAAETTDRTERERRIREVEGR